MMRPSDLADPRLYRNDVVEFEIKWSNDSTTAMLSVLCNGSKHRLQMTIAELDLLREFLAANIE